MIEIELPPFAQGKERACYRHPHDSSKIIKIPIGDEKTQTEREIAFYQSMQRRGLTDFSHLPRFYGTVETGLGTGLVLDLVADSDGEISKSLQWYLENGMPVSEVETLLNQLKSYLLDNLVIFNHDMFSGNMLLQKTAGSRDRLVIIDGLGDVVTLDWLNRLPFHVRSKINRRWQRFLRRFYNNPYVRKQTSSQP